MPNQIYDIKEQLVGHMMRCLQANGLEKVDLDEMSALADIVKDLTEADYYQTVTEAMDGYGYTDTSWQYHDPKMGYNPNRDSRGRYASRPRMGYGQPVMRYGYDPQAFNDMLAGATPEEREQMKRALGM